LQHYAGARSLYIQEGRQDKGRKTAPRAGARDSVMSGRLLISGRHLWSLMSGRLLISGRHLILTPGSSAPALCSYSHSCTSSSETALTASSSASAGTSLPTSVEDRNQGPPGCTSGQPEGVAPSTGPSTSQSPSSPPLTGSSAAASTRGTL